MNIVKGDLIAMADEGLFDVIIHGCNCFNTMGSGIARSLRERWPQVYAADNDHTMRGDYNKLGNYTVAQVFSNKSDGSTGPFMVVNAYTQYGYNGGGNGTTGKQSNDVFEYKSFDLILQKLAHHYPNSRFGFPMIGMGLAGGNSVKILGSLGEFSETVTATGGSVTLVEFAL